MKPRARRVTIAAAVLGAAVVAVLLVAHWATVRDHVEAWHFQLTTETVTIEPNPPHGPLRVKGNARYFCGLLADHSGQPVILAAEEDVSIIFAESLEGELTRVTQDILTANGYRVLEQRFPRRAYVVIHGEHVAETAPAAEQATIRYVTKDEARRKYEALR